MVPCLHQNRSTCIDCGHQQDKAVASSSGSSRWIKSLHVIGNNTSTYLVTLPAHPLEILLMADRRHPCLLPDTGVLRAAVPRALFSSSLFGREAPRAVTSPFVCDAWYMPLRPTTAPCTCTNLIIAYAPTECTASGPGLVQAEVNQEASFTIEGRDALGRRLHTGGKWFDVRLTTEVHADLWWVVYLS